MKIDILAFGAHPDDVELSCGGTILKEIHNGKTVGIIDLTKGELGTRGTVQTRATEASNAASILGVSFRKNLSFSDGFIANDKAHQLEVIKLIRHHQPEIVLCNAIDDRHIDHGVASKLVSDACFLSGLIKIETKSLDSEAVQAPWRPKSIYHYIQWKPLEPDFVVDISDHIDKKMESVMAYSTQFYNPNSQDPETPISSKNFVDSVRYRAADLGRLIGVGYAEGFNVERLPAIDSLFDLK
ncbi:bacillithiol biosynthesis deacetylase BshB1 [Flavobacteriaceae bacterium]|jgi:bacillithiol biosynthesis deacetylase BshB1|nr:bacillithiol biosynthesis deacetylase BshB1 [Flavobacteriaceae bacterium]|tara:strand:+ start:5486 stop:6208 length:723 start_codon:yes stop_codon:yes gene_type:complete